MAHVPAVSDVEKRVQFWIRIFNGFGLPTALLGVAIFAGYKFAMPMYEKQTRFIEKLEEGLEKLEEGLEKVADNSQVMADSLKAMSEQITTQTKSIQSNSARMDTIAEKIQHN